MLHHNRRQIQSKHVCHQKQTIIFIYGICPLTFLEINIVSNQPLQTPLAHCISSLFIIQTIRDGVNITLEKNLTYSTSHIVL
jgi:hypothetical protein